MPQEMLTIVITSEGNYNTTESHDSIYEKYTKALANEESKLFSFKGNTAEISQNEGEVQDCIETIILNATDTKLVGFKMYSNLGEIRKSEPIELEDEVKMLGREIAEKTERKESIEKALDDPDFIEYREFHLKSLEAKQRFLEKGKTVEQK